MKSKILFVSAAVALLPSVALASEPAKGTIIMVSSVGLWVVGSSILMVIKGASKKPEEPKKDDHSSQA